MKNVFLLFNSSLINTFVLCLAFMATLAGCAVKKLPHWQGAPVEAQFSARVLPQAADMPLQGGLRIGPQGGDIGIILQMGRTLGQCRLEQDAAGLRLDCRPAQGVGVAGQSLLHRTALAVCRVLPLLMQKTAPQPADWHATLPTTSGAPHSSVLQRVVYEDTLGSVDIVFEEVRHP